MRIKEIIFIFIDTCPKRVGSLIDVVYGPFIHIITGKSSEEARMDMDD